MLPFADALLSPAPYAALTSGRATLRFFLGDCLDVMAALPAHSVSAIVTSPPYNLGVDYRTYDDSLPRSEYLAWTDAWVKAAARVLAPDGSLFLNVGTKPTDPWTAMEVAQVARAHLRLQNTIHWIKSIAIERECRGDRRALDRDIAVATTSRSTVRVSSTTATSSSSTSRRAAHGARPLRDWRALPGR
jgi:hypothetical protein